MNKILKSMITAIVLYFWIDITFYYGKKIIITIYDGSPKSIKLCIAFFLTILLTNLLALLLGIFIGRKTKR